MTEDPKKLKKDEISIESVIENVVDQREEEGPNIEISEQKEFFKVPKRFGNVPVDALPLGYTKGKEYRDKFPRIDLPFQKIEEISFGSPELEPNKLFWGDNLHIMRSLPSESIELIYIDPPFFSGRQYNIIFGDQNEIRSFSDIWDGGMPTYLIWLNSRLLEMKRLLKPTGSICVHLDWHAAHYVKVEMDKIFGYDNFMNEIIWHYDTGGASKKRFSRKHDNIFWYTKTDNYKYYGERIKIPRSEKAIERAQNPKGARISKGDTEKNPNDVFIIQQMNPMAKERIGYPTQKPEALLEQIIKASSDDGDIVADFFCGGGTTPAVAQKLGRRWIASDISRIAVEITKGRILKLLKGEGHGWFVPEKTPNIQIISWGYYDIPSLSNLSQEGFEAFIIKAFGAQRISDPKISGLKNGIPVWVGTKDNNEYITDDDVLDFAQYLNEYYENRKKGIMVGWQFSDKAKQAKEMLAKMGAGIDFINIDLVNIGSDAFREHITSKHPEYGTFLRFIMPPVVRLKIKRKGPLQYDFDFSEAVSLNNGKIINIQADFDYNKAFVPTSGYAFISEDNSSDSLLVSYKFDSAGKKTVAFKVEDNQGGETMVIKEIEVN